MSPAIPWHRRLHALGLKLRRHWPHWWAEVLAALLAISCGVLQIGPHGLDLLRDLRGFTQLGGGISRLLDLAGMPRVMLGGAMLLMAVGLLARLRLAWVISLLLTMLASGLALWFHHRPDAVFVSAAALGLLLLLTTRRYSRVSLALGTLFAILSIGGLMIYGVLGSLFFGADYQPPITDLPTALYYAVETMSTVGYGDILPHTVQARMFTVSMILLGITVFITTLSVVVGPVLGNSIKRALEDRMQKQIRRNHFVILGTSGLAYTMWKDLHQRGVPVTVVVSQAVNSPYPADADLVVGDASRAEVLVEAGVPLARAVLTLRDDDAENAFAVLAVKELAPGVKTVAGVNDARHLAKIRRVQPDMLFAPQVLGSDLLVRTLFDEPIDNDLVSRLLFAQQA